MGKRPQHYVVVGLTISLGFISQLMSFKGITTPTAHVERVIKASRKYSIKKTGGIMEQQTLNIIAPVQMDEYREELKRIRKAEKAARKEEDNQDSWKQIKKRWLK